MNTCSYTEGGMRIISISLLTREHLEERGKLKKSLRKPSYILVCCTILVWRLFRGRVMEASPLRFCDRWALAEQSAMSAIPWDIPFNELVIEVIEQSVS
jgi:hypothetical protein